MRLPKSIEFTAAGRFQIADTQFSDVKFLKAQEQTLNTLTTVGKEVGWVGRLSDGKTHCLLVDWVLYNLSPGGTLTQVHECWTQVPVDGATWQIGDRLRLNVTGQETEARVVKLWRNGKGFDLRLEGTSLTVKRSYDRLFLHSAIRLEPAPFSIVVDELTTDENS
jgi:hypothetical protein